MSDDTKRPDLIGEFMRTLFLEVVGPPVPATREATICRCGRRRADCTESADTMPLLRCGCCNWDDHSGNMTDTRAGYICRECEETIEVKP